MSTTHCQECLAEIEYSDETYYDERPEFCSNRCSRQHWMREEKPYDEEWYDVNLLEENEE